MQPQTDRPDRRTQTAARPPRGDEEELYRLHHRQLVRAVSRAITASSELIEDACQSAWAILLRRQPERERVFSWLYVVAIHEAYAMLARERRNGHLEALGGERSWEVLIADPVSLDDRLDALEALRLLADLPERQRRDLALVVAGFSYREIMAMTGGRTFTNVNKHLAKARARVRMARLRETGAKHRSPRSS